MRADARRLTVATAAMGTRFELVLYDPGPGGGSGGGGADDAGHQHPRLRALGEAALAEIEEADRRLSLFRKDSLLSHLNRTAARAPLALDADTFELFELCDQLTAASQGAFDPTVAPLMRALGLHGERSSAPDLDLHAARARLGWDAVVLDHARRRVGFEGAGVALDLGAIAKGHGLDLAARVLREHGVRRALLHGGTSTVVALGAPPGEAGWRVAVGPGERAPVAVLRDACLSVSAPVHGAPGGRVVGGPDGSAGHVIDPRRGEPAAGVACAAVIAPRAALADAWSTALVVAGDALPPREDVETLHAVGPVGALRWRHRGSTRSSFTRIPTPIPSA